MGTSTQTLPPPTSSSPEIPTPPPSPQPPRVIQTAQLISAMVKSHGHVSDLIFSPGRAPQIEMNGQMIELKCEALESLTPQDTMSIANDIMGKNETALRNLEQDGSADLSYGLCSVARFLLHIFRQRA